MKQRIGLSLLLLGLCATCAWAGQTPINLSSEANASWCGHNEINCSTFPSGSQTYNDVSFEIPTTNDAWFSYVAAGGGSGHVSVTIPVNVTEVKTVYTLMNTDWGTTQTGLLSITFNGTNGATWTYQMTGGTDIRDYNQNGSTTNSISCRLPNKITAKAGSVGTLTGFSNGQGQRLDMQIFELPTSFKGQTLTSVTITDSGNTNVQRAFIAAMTVSTVAP